MPTKLPYRLRFWGVRGSMPTPSAEKMRYGGNTSCVELELGPGRRLVFDAGTGIRNLGDRLLKEFPEQSQDIHVFLSHYHYDHVQGLAFFAPMLRPETRISFRGPKPEMLGLREFLEWLVSPPLFPVALATAPSDKTFIELDHEVTAIEDLTVTPVPLHHPQGATGYRVDCGGRSFVYLTDHEHGNEAVDAAIAEVTHGVGTLIIDSHFKPEDYETHRGWGHSTWQKTAELARSVEASRLILFHHNPLHTDADMDEIEAAARAIFPNTQAAREGMELEL